MKKLAVVAGEAVRFKDRKVDNHACRQREEGHVALRDAGQLALRHCSLHRVVERFAKGIRSQTPAPTRGGGKKPQPGCCVGMPP